MGETGLAVTRREIARAAGENWCSGSRRSSIMNGTNDNELDEQNPSQRF